MLLFHYLISLSSRSGSQLRKNDPGWVFVAPKVLIPFEEFSNTLFLHFLTLQIKNTIYKNIFINQQSKLCKTIMVLKNAIMVLTNFRVRIFQCLKCGHRIGSISFYKKASLS